MSKSEKIQPTSLSKKMDGKDYTINIREISNGFVIRQTVNFTDAKGKYHYKSKETYTKTNPLSNVKSDNDGDESFDFENVDLSTFEEGY